MARVSSLFDSAVAFIGVTDDGEAAGNLIDALEGRKGAILVNVAPRHGNAKKWKNGSPFGYFWHGETLVVGTIDDITFSLVKKLGLAASLRIIDTARAIEELVKSGLAVEHSKHYIAETQFRSYDFLPRIAAYLLAHHDLPGDICSIDKIPDMLPMVWWVDNFGNCKTTLLLREIDFTQGKTIETLWGALPYIARLKDVPDQASACIRGSSGVGENRFLEIVVQGGSAAERFAIKSGDHIFNLEKP
ncbi:MAG: hypothetical protein G01um101433_417 [Parcubacteria group bacterium Gr01-1014_33]|nr:MAG: hypothetical protein G01um101433_417 [Parcubacteria group bacterium Gr01-1014_33]